MRPRFFRPAVLVLWMLTLCGLARADIQNPGRSSFPGERSVNRQGEKPPNALAVTASVVQGGTVSVVLRARGHAGEMVDFLLRTPPEHGTLDAAPRRLTLNSASVTYTPRPGDDALADSFTYAVQTRTSAVSAEERVVIRIQDAPPVLAVVPAELDFGAVKAGESTRAEVTLTNQGGGEAVGRLDPPAPWVVDGSASYRLSRGASQTFALVFQPTGERAYTDALHFRYETGGGVRLVGTGLAGPGQPVVGGTQAALAGHLLSPRNAPGVNDGAASLPPVSADTSRSGRDPGAPVPVAVPRVTSLESSIQGGGGSSMPSAADPSGTERDDNGVTGFSLTARGRTTMDLSWRAPEPPPKSYRVEMRDLSLDPDERLVVEWRPYARVDFELAHGFVNARLSGLSPASEVCVRIVAVDAAGRLAAPSPLLVMYTLPPATWWRPTPLKVLFALLLVCGGLALRHRWEVNQILGEIDASRRRTTA